MSDSITTLPEATTNGGRVRDTRRDNGCRSIFLEPLTTKGKAMELIIRVIIDMIRDLLRDK